MAAVWAIWKQELLPSAMQQDRALARSGKDVAAQAALKRKSGDLDPHPTVNRTKMLQVKNFLSGRGQKPYKVEDGTSPSIR
jgi:hypothetical protein